jgi:hypothetical protein
MKIFSKESVETLNKWQNWTLDEANDEKYFEAFKSLLLEEKREDAVELWNLLQEAARENGEHALFNFHSSSSVFNSKCNRPVPT